VLGAVRWLAERGQIVSRRQIAKVCAQMLADGQFKHATGGGKGHPPGPLEPGKRFLVLWLRHRDTWTSQQYADALGVSRTMAQRRIAQRRAIEKKKCIFC
jgi:hypothetical protein